MKELFHIPVQTDQSVQLTLYVPGAPLATLGGVDQTAARAKNRPDSGVTVIEVPKTAETCSEVIT